MSISASPTESLALELVAALKEVNDVGTARQAALQRWAEARSKLLRRKNGEQVALERAFQREITILRELDKRLEEAKRRARRIDDRMGQAQKEWALRNRMEFSRSQLL